MPHKKFPARLANGGQPTISGLSLIRIPRLNSAQRLKRIREEQDLCSFHDLITEDKSGTIQKDRKNRYYMIKRFVLPFLFSNGDFFFGRSLCQVRSRYGSGEVLDTGEWRTGYFLRNKLSPTPLYLLTLNQSLIWKVYNLIRF